ncbi:MAG: HAMP domain-containing histidine kinase [Bacteroidales bacterium]|nr:HAMP domain-containing histidine kinase [Bacteroidales bacterium]
MTIKVRLSLQFTLLVTVILLFFSVLVYYFSYTSQVAKFRRSLFDSARNTATLFINVEEIDSLLLNKIQQSTVSWEREELALTDSAFNLIYGNNLQYLSDSSTFENYARESVNYFSIREKDGVCYKHSYGNRTYFVYAMAFDRSRSENLEELKRFLFWSIIISISLSVILSYLFSKRAIKPISKIIKNVKEINSYKLGTRLDEGARKDEIDQLAITFNEMLSNLEIAFRNQEDFVSNASHQLRTPLAVMIGESDYILSHEQKKEEYVTHIARLFNDLKNMNTLLNSLLELAQINRSDNINLMPTRLDELIFNAIQQTKSKYPGRRIIPKIQYPENENDLIVSVNSGLLSMAFSNIIDNACKFSDDDVTVEFEILNDLIKVIISDKGIGIPAEEIENVFLPFNRGSNARFKSGYGIGLALVKRIIDLHDAKINVISSEEAGTKFELTFKRVR